MVINLEYDIFDVAAKSLSAQLYGRSSWRAAILEEGVETFEEGSGKDCCSLQVNDALQNPGASACNRFADTGM
jgi:hypothetical protein